MCRLYLLNVLQVAVKAADLFGIILVHQKFKTKIMVIQHFFGEFNNKFTSYHMYQYPNGLLAVLSIEDIFHGTFMFLNLIFSRS